VVKVYLKTFSGGESMKIKWLGHASFLLTSEEGKKIITDPYSVAGGISYAPIDESADVVTVSHDHEDHNNYRAVKGSPHIIKREGISKVEGIEFKGIASYHDSEKGSQRGSNIIFCFTVDGIKICHLGDLGHLLSPKQIIDIGPVDIVLIPVGGYYTIDAEKATAVSQSLKAKVVIPMHYKTTRCGYPISQAEEFLIGKKNVRTLNASEVEFGKEKLPEETEIVVLQHAL
jgi:L-ascorbate metabolism protein UlaG (beta-lactamase superfamily)